MILYTDRLIIRPWCDEDAESLYKYATDPDVGPVAGWPVHKSVDDSLNIIRTVLSADGTFAVCLKEDNIAIGSIGLIPPAQSQTKAADTEIEIGYWIGKPFWGHGYIPEAVKRLQQFAFLELGYAAIWCGYYDGNEKSKKCQEKCGFKYHHSEHNKFCAPMNDYRTEHFTYLTKEQWEKNRSSRLIVYIHGMGGNVEEVQHYKKLFSAYDVVGFDYRSDVPWEARDEFYEYFSELKCSYKSVTVIANSIGAYFCLLSLNENLIDQLFMISPIVDMEKLIDNMMNRSGISEEELKQKQTVTTQFNEILSWEYLCWVRDNHPECNMKSHILYGSNDSLQSINSIKAFIDKFSSELTVMDNGEHYFHTKEQMEFLDNWLKLRINC